MYFGRMHSARQKGRPISLRWKLAPTLLPSVLSRSCAKKEAAAWQKAVTFLLNYVARHIVLLFSFRV
jgi:hypothetical protein